MNDHQASTVRRLGNPRPTATNPVAARVLLFLVRHRVPVLKRICEIVLGGDINCVVPPNLLLPHPYGITIHSGALIGADVVIMQQVTIGGRGDGLEVPIIEHDVLIGAGAKVLGGVRVGHHAKVGANAVVSKNVPPHSTVVGFDNIIRRDRERSASAH
jgi:serine O-acetyltransferase